LMAAPRRHVTTKFELKLTLRSLSPSYVTLKTASSRKRDYYSPPRLYFGFKQGRREARADEWQQSTRDSTQMGDKRKKTRTQRRPRQSISTPLPLDL
jgi:hypothetical protein